MLAGVDGRGNSDADGWIVRDAAARLRNGACETMPLPDYESRYFWGRIVNWDALVTLICVLAL